MLGEAIGHFRVLDKLGSGGMGEVYKAEDLKLHRHVALKFLPPGMHDSKPARDRFEREARVIAGLNHPNICILHDFGEHQGRPFLVLELLEGQTLRVAIQSRPAPLEALLDWAIQIADALDFAHRRGVIHRDLKPANIFITRHRQAKILDYGLARLHALESPSALLEAETASLPSPHLTSPGAILGTVAYMSPEQARSEEVDARSDIFSFGLVLYEALTGRQCFQAKSTAEIFQQILTQAPVPPAQLRPEASSGLDRIILRALEKDPDLRYQTVSDLRSELKRLRRDLAQAAAAPSGASPSAGKMALAVPAADRSGASSLAASAPAHLPAGPVAASSLTASNAGQPILAVLPFDNAGGDPETEYLSDGITENLMNGLSQLGPLKVLARGTVFHYKGRKLDPLAIGRELQAHAVLTGRVLRRGEALIIGAELTEIAQGSQLWGERYKRQLQDIFDVQEEISRVILEKMRLRLTPREEQKLAHRGTASAEAYEWFLKGLYGWNQWTRAGLLRAEQCFRRATDADAAYVQALHGLGSCYSLSANLGLTEPGQAYPQVIELGRRLLAMDERLPYGHFLIGITKFFYSYDAVVAEEYLRRAVELDPAFALGWCMRCFALCALHKPEAALDGALKARDMDPDSAVVAYLLGHHFLLNQRYPEAESMLRRTLALEPNFHHGRMQLGRCLLLLGKSGDGLRELEICVRDTRDEHPYALGYLGYAYGQTGRWPEAEKVRLKLKQYSLQRYTPAFALALVNLGMEENAQVMEYLNRAYSAGEAPIATLQFDPNFIPQRSDPRFQDLIRSVGMSA